MQTRRGTTNRVTGKTTPRTKAKTHWGSKASPRRAATPHKSGKVAAAKLASSKK